MPLMSFNGKDFEVLADQELVQPNEESIEQGKGPVSAPSQTGLFSWADMHPNKVNLFLIGLNHLLICPDHI